MIPAASDCIAQSVGQQEGIELLRAALSRFAEEKNLLAVALVQTAIDNIENKSAPFVEDTRPVTEGEPQG